MLVVISFKNSQTKNDVWENRFGQNYFSNSDFPKQTYSGNIDFRKKLGKTIWDKHDHVLFLNAWTPQDPWWKPWWRPRAVGYGISPSNEPINAFVNCYWLGDLQWFVNHYWFCDPRDLRMPLLPRPWDCLGSKHCLGSHGSKMEISKR